MMSFLSPSITALYSIIYNTRIYNLYLLDQYVIYHNIDRS